LGTGIKLLVSPEATKSRKYAIRRTWDAPSYEHKPQYLICSITWTVRIFNTFLHHKRADTEHG
jgi:hypothetical protein